MLRNLCFTAIILICSGCTESTTTAESNIVHHYAYFTDFSTISAVNLDIENPTPTVVAQLIEPAKDESYDHVGIPDFIPRMAVFVVAKTGISPAQGRGIIYVDNHRLWGLEFESDKQPIARQLSNEYIHNLCEPRVLHDELYYKNTTAPLIGPGFCPANDHSPWRKINLDSKPNDVTADLADNPNPSGISTMMYAPPKTGKFFLGHTHSSDYLQVTNSNFQPIYEFTELKYLNQSLIANNQGNYILPAINQQDESIFYLFNLATLKSIPLQDLPATAAFLTWSGALQSFIFSTKNGNENQSLLSINLNGKITTLLTRPQNGSISWHAVTEETILFSTWYQDIQTSYEVDLRSKPFTPKQLDRVINTEWREFLPKTLEWHTYVTRQAGCGLINQPACSGLVRTKDGAKIEIPSARWIYNKAIGDRSATPYLVLNTTTDIPSTTYQLTMNEMGTSNLHPLLNFDTTIPRPWTQIQQYGYRQDLFAYTVDAADPNSMQLALIDNVSKTAKWITNKGKNYWLGQSMQRGLWGK